MHALLGLLGLALVTSSQLACTGGTKTPPVGDAGSDAPPRVDAAPCAAEQADFPEPAEGRCEGRILDPGATLPVGDDGAGGFITPGAKRLTHAGTVIELTGFPMKALLVPGTRFIVVTDGGVGTEFLSVVDLDTMSVVDQHTFAGGEDSPEALFFGLAVSSDGERLWASGGGTNMVWAFGFDPATGQAERAPDRDLTLADDSNDGYVSGIALLPDDRTLLVNLLLGDALVVVDTSDGTEERRIAMPDVSRPYDVVVTPDGATAFVSLWNARAIVPVDLEAGAVGSMVLVEKNPEGLALSADGTSLIAANSDNDSLSVIDVAASAVISTVYIGAEAAPRGSSPSAGAFGPDGRLYVVNAGDNAVDVFAASAMGLGRQGRIPTMWYPTDVTVLSDGTVVILNGKHVGSGPNTRPSEIEITGLMAGSMTVLAPEEVSAEYLRSWDTEIATNNDRASRFEDVECPDAAAYDFPIPRPGEGPSTKIEHVVLVVRENKTYDAYLGDLETDDGTPHGNGDPTLTIVPGEEIEQVIPNTRAIAREFAMSDNYYSSAEQSVQGHFWTMHGRTTDFVERTWLSTWGRSYYRVPPQGILEEAGSPEEGGVFGYFIDHGVEVSNYGEIVGVGGVPPDSRYPGIVFALGVSDVKKADWVGSQARRSCALRGFTYIVMPNDHTYGLRAGSQTPRSMMADNDAGVGRLIEWLSHSTYWPSTVVFVIEDDPQDGGDHVDNHRSPVFVVSPWAKRGYVSSVHYNESSIYRTIQQIFGIEEPLNAYWANASPMYDLFTGTPDYTPYVAIARRWPEETNPDDGSGMATISARWDFSVPDEQPGLSRLLWQHLRGTQPPWRQNIDLPMRDEDD